MTPFLSALALLLALPAPGAPAGEPIAVEASAVALNPAAPGQDRVGSLVFRGGLVLRSADRRFGGAVSSANRGEPTRRMDRHTTYCSTSSRVRFFIPSFQGPTATRRRFSGAKIARAVACRSVDVMPRASC